MLEDLLHPASSSRMQYSILLLTMKRHLLLPALVVIAAFMLPHFASASGCSEQELSQLTFSCMGGNLNGNNAASCRTKAEQQCRSGASAQSPQTSGGDSLKCYASNISCSKTSGGCCFNTHDARFSANGGHFCCPAGTQCVNAEGPDWGKCQ
jgi:hypothetical protein